MKRSLLLVALVACGTSPVTPERALVSSSGQAEQHDGWCGDLAKPPYTATSQQVTLLYVIPTRRIADLVAPELTPVSVLGHTLLTVLYTRFSDVESRGSSCREHDYNEVSYGVPAYADGHVGLTFFKLQLNSVHARDAGVVYYGYPKELSDVEASNDDGRLSARATSPSKELQFAFTGEVKEGLVSTLLGTLTEWGFDVAHLFGSGVRILLVKDGVPNVSTMDLQIEESALVRTVDVQTPYLNALGVLDPDDVPIGGFLYGKVKVLLSAPTFLSSSQL